jgi:hypothetical protein
MKTKTRLRGSISVATHSHSHRIIDNSHEEHTEEPNVEQSRLVVPDGDGNYTSHVTNT